MKVRLVLASLVMLLSVDLVFSQPIPAVAERSYAIPVGTLCRQVCDPVTGQCRWEPIQQASAPAPSAAVRYADPMPSSPVYTYNFNAPVSHGPVQYVYPTATQGYRNEAPVAPVPPAPMPKASYYSEPAPAYYYAPAAQPPQTSYSYYAATPVVSYYAAPPVGYTYAVNPASATYSSSAAPSYRQFLLPGRQRAYSTGHVHGFSAGTACVGGQ